MDDTAKNLLRVSVLFSHARSLQMISLLCFLLVLSLQTLLTVVKHAKPEQIELSSTIHDNVGELEVTTMIQSAYQEASAC